MAETIAEQEKDSIKIPCPCPDCVQEHEVTVTGIDLTTNVTENCEGCGNEIRVHDGSVNRGSFNIHSIEDDGREHTDRWVKKEISEEENDVWKRL